MTREELEFSISQYIDGTLPVDERAALDEVLASDSEARALLAEYQQLDTLVKRAPSIPNLDWQRLQDRISSHVTEQQVEVTSVSGGRWMRRFAIAAGILVCIGITVPLMRRGTSTPQVSRILIEINAPAGATFAQNTPTHTSMPEITIGPSAQVAGATWQYDDGLMTRPSRVVIAATPSDAQDGNNVAPF